MKQSKKQQRLQTRIQDWAKTVNSTSPECSKKGLRKETNGFRKPGSNNK